MSFLAGWDLETVCSADGSMFSELNEIIRYVERLQGSIATWLKWQELRRVIGRRAGI